MPTETDLPTPTATAPADATATPDVVHLRLADGSSISFAPSDMESPVGPEPLSGTLEETYATTWPPPFEGDTLAEYLITHVDFESMNFTVTGDMGLERDLAGEQCVDAQIQTSVEINGQPVSLYGSGPFCSPLQISGDGYTLTLVLTGAD